MTKKIKVEHLKVGMFVTELDRPWLETPFLRTRFQIKSQQQIVQLQKYCHYVFIDTQKGIDIETRPEPAESEKPVQNGISQRIDTIEGGSAQSQVSFEEEVQQALETRSKTKQVVDHMLEDVRIGRSIDSADAREAVENIMDSITRNHEALVCLTQLKDRDEYTSIHSMNVSILCIAFARHLGLNAEQIRVIGVGALLHDLGKMRVPIEILNKPGRLTPEEFDIMKNHVVLGGEIIKKTPGISPRSLRVVMEHHERFKGGGYPQGLQEGQISLVGQLAAIVDVYDAITSDRVYHNHLHPHEAIKRMYEWSERDFNRPLFEKFIRCVGIYPLGSLVEINGTDIGIVISSNSTSALKPDVLLVMDSQLNRYPKVRKISLSEQDSSGKKDTWAITRVRDAVAEGIQIDLFLCNYSGD
jgi:putative nucleotidyltransferase with HDIG domain